MLKKSQSCPVSFRPIQPLDSNRVIAEAPGYAYDQGFAVNPRTGAVVYSATRADETDLELLKLGHV